MKNKVYSFPQAGLDFFSWKFNPLYAYIFLSSPEDPAEFDGDLDGVRPEPVDLGSRKGTKDKKQNKKRKAANPKSSSSKASKKPRPPAAPLRREQALDMERVLGSFSESYRAIIQALPPCLWPSSDKHGEHSYTVPLV